MRTPDRPARNLLGVEKKVKLHEFVTPTCDGLVGLTSVRLTRTKDAPLDTRLVGAH